MRKTFGIVLAGVLASVLSAAWGGGAQAEPAAGAWTGVLASPTLGDVTVALRLKPAAGGYEGVLDVPDVGSLGAPVTASQPAPDRLVVEIPAARTRYEGRWDAATSQWSGTWTSAALPDGRPLRLSRGAPAPARADGLDGDWLGVLNLPPAGQLRIVFHIRTGPQGTTATFDSPDQGGGGLPASVRRNGREVLLGAAGGRLFGELSDDGTAIQGEFVQGPALMPVVLRRGGDLPAVAPPAPSEGPREWTAPPDAAIRAALARRVDAERRAVGVVVGVVTPKGRRVVAYGAPAVGDPRPVDGDTLFEIGSISKTFTALLLQDMALRGEVALDDPVAKHLPPDLRPPTRDGREITLRQLATHTSGLPGNIPNPRARRVQDILAASEMSDLRDFLASYRLTRDPGADWEYSNVGVGLLGVALAHRAGVDLETLIRTRITGPLGMSATSMAVPAALQARLATGHDAYLRPVEPIAIGPAVAAAGQIRSSANDMLTYLAAELDSADTPLGPAMRAMLSETRPGLGGRYQQALGWMAMDPPSGRIFTHSGGTFGQRAFAAFNPRTREGVVVLTNAEGTTGADDLGLWIISGAPLRPLPPAPRLPAAHAERAEQALAADAARPFLGRYRLTRSVTMTVGYADGRLTLQSEARGVKGPVQPAAWHGGGDFSADNGGGDRVDLAFQPGPGGAPAITWRGPGGEFVLRREDLPVGGGR
jgi:CubicO group peptidase (beta-lactamase class C family)